MLLVLRVEERTCSASRTVGACIDTSPVSPTAVGCIRAPTRSPNDSQPVAFTQASTSRSSVANGRSLSGSENIAGSIPALRSTAFGSTPSSARVGRIAAAFLTLIVAKRGFARVTRSKPASSRGADYDRSVRCPGGRIRIPRHLAQFADFWAAKSMTATSWKHRSPPPAVECGKRGAGYVRSPTCRRLAAFGGPGRREPAKQQRA